jgi:cation diffusion facilitator CzcD-associated flavoprotein CzcO
MKKTRVLILGGGFGGLYAALEWTLDLFFAKDFVQYLRVERSRQLIPADDSATPREACDSKPETNPPP